MAVQFQLHVLDPEDVEKHGAPVLVGFSLRGMTPEQGRAAAAYARAFATKVEQHINSEEQDMKKYGTGEVIPEPDDQPKDEAKPSLTSEEVAAIMDEESDALDAMGD